jgi:NAD(P)-dependent dehydrogenase (short-subunit alcohol dehydrogenase family)
MARIGGGRRRGGGIRQARYSATRPISRERVGARRARNDLRHGEGATPGRRACSPPRIAARSGAEGGCPSRRSFIGLCASAAFFACGKTQPVVLFSCPSQRSSQTCDAAAPGRAFGECISLPADASGAAGTRALAASYLAREPTLDILVDNAGAARGAEASRQRPAKVINIAESMAVNRQDTYSDAASKAGLIHLTKGLALELAVENIVVSAIAHGASPQT